MKIFDINLIKTEVDVTDKKELFEMMVEDLFQQGVISDKHSFLSAILAREAALSTGIGYGIAIPHGRHDDVKEMKAVVYTLSSGIEYDALDGNPVLIVFMLAVPTAATSIYMKMLGAISKALHVEDNRMLFLTSDDPNELFDFLQGIHDEPV